MKGRDIMENMNICSFHKLYICSSTNVYYLLDTMERSQAVFLKLWIIRVCEILRKMVRNSWTRCPRVWAQNSVLVPWSSHNLKGNLEVTFCFSGGQQICMPYPYHLTLSYHFSAGQNLKLPAPECSAWGLPVAPPAVEGAIFNQRLTSVGAEY